MISATNGSILAYAFQDQTPEIKELRSLSTTVTAAYTGASEGVLVFEAQISRAMSVVTPLTDHVLLAVTGPEGKISEPTSDRVGADMTNGTDADSGDSNKFSEGEAEDDRDDGPQEQIRADLETVSEQLTAALRTELSNIRWPEDF